MIPGKKQGQILSVESKETQYFDYANDSQPKSHTQFVEIGEVGNP
ncbi:MAG: hypothetical protein R2827_07880 [Bdellovibrionales bacterium]